jgi:hypothetical protein
MQNLSILLADPIIGGFVVNLASSIVWDGAKKSYGAVTSRFFPSSANRDTALETEFSSLDATDQIKRHVQHLIVAVERLGGGDSTLDQFSCDLAVEQLTSTPESLCLFTSIHSSSDFPFSTKRLIRWEAIGDAGANWLQMTREPNPLPPTALLPSCGLKCNGLKTLLNEQCDAGLPDALFREPLRNLDLVVAFLSSRNVYREPVRTSDSPPFLGCPPVRLEQPAQLLFAADLGDRNRSWRFGFAVRFGFRQQLVVLSLVGENDSNRPEML